MDDVGERSGVLFNRPHIRARDARIRQVVQLLPAGAQVLDVGAGGSPPYRRLLEERGYRYVGLDISGPSDVIGRAEYLPFSNESFDLVICVQVMEHLDSPSAAVAEFARVLRFGGRALISTPGAFPYHPAPRDLWRWTAEGLHELFAAQGLDATVYGLTGTATTISMLVSLYIEAEAKRAPRLSFMRALIPLLHWIGRSVDRRFAELTDPWATGSLFMNYFVDGTKNDRSGLHPR